MCESDIDGTQVLRSTNNNITIFVQNFTLKYKAHILPSRTFINGKHMLFKRHFHGGSKNTQTAVAFAQLAWF